MSAEPHVSHVEESDPDALQIAFIGAVGAILVVAVIFLIQGLYERRVNAEFQRKVIPEVPRALREARIEQLEKFQPRFIDKEKGIVAVPIEEAMAAVVASPDPAAPVVAAAAVGAKK